MGILAVAWLLKNDAPWLRLEGWLQWLGVLGPSAKLGQPLRERLTYGVAAFGGATVLAAIREVGEVFPVTWNVVARNGSIDQMFRPAAGVCVAAAGALLAVVAATKVQESPLPLVAPVATTPVLISLHGRDDVEVTPRTGARFVLTFDREATRQSLRGAEGDLSVWPTEFDRRFVETLVSDLADCSRLSPRPLVIEVAGFSSSSEWAGERPQVSPHKNLALARLRARNVATVLNRVAVKASANIDVRPKRWTSLQEMERERWFNDRPLAPGLETARGSSTSGGAEGLRKVGATLASSGFSAKAARLTRRAELRLEWAAGCEGDVAQQVALR
jgi:hypothetical protein